MADSGQGNSRVRNNNGSTFYVPNGISENLEKDLVAAILSGDSKQWLHPTLETLVNKCNLTEEQRKLMVSLPGPLQDTVKYPNGLPEVALDMLHAITLGEPHIKIADWQLEYGSDGLASNIVIPKILFQRTEIEKGKWQFEVPSVVLEAVIAHPDDAARLARFHIKKQPNFTVAMFGSMFSTPDVNHWRRQREHFVPGFLPFGVLERVFPLSLARAQHCPAKLRQLCGAGAAPVDMNEFFLHETKAQLQLVLFGLDEEFMEGTNKRLRDALQGKEPREYPVQYLAQLLRRVEAAGKAGPSHMHSGCPVVGPLSERLATVENTPADRLGNAMIFSFAGHGTTGETLSWLAFELARHPEFQDRLVREVDQFWAMLGSLGRGVEYRDLAHLPFLTRCIVETLRLWNAMAAGTHRELVRKDSVEGFGGEEVVLPKGTYVKIPNWSRHRNPDLWGPDANEFNPDRDFHGDEIWNGDVFRAYSPATPRFSPFSFPPRDW